MRLHRLEVEAFGPFASRQTVDFDALAEHGLFLLNGATGAGKTSVLDAVCFALFGGLPGARQGSKSLKSHHADAGAQPEVVLEFSAQGRRFEVRRTPAWDRPSARAKNGVTTQQASTHLRELVAREWQPLSSRNDEASDVLRGVLGMDREQFTRVAMLPQGEFAAFLRADPKEREKLLESLFSTGRFGDIEAQLAAMAQDAEGRAAAAEVRARFPLRQLEAELAGLDSAQELESLENMPLDETTPLDEDIPLDESIPLDSPAVERRFEGAEELFARRSAEAGMAITTAREELAHARAADEACRRAVEDASELRRARERRARWEAEVPAHRERSERLDRAAAAASLRAELDGEHRASAAAEAADADLRIAFAAAAAVGWEPAEGIEPSAAGLRAEAAEARAQAAVVAERIPLEDELEQLEGERRRADEAADRSEAVVARLDLELAEIDRPVEDLMAERSRVEPTAAARAGVERDFEAARETLEAVHEYAAAFERLGTARGRHDQLRAAALDRRTEWLDLREQRLAHTAFELAAELEAGTACPVCGSEEHPDPAAGERDPLELVDREKEALTASERATELERAASAAAAEASAAVAAAAARGGDADPDKAARAVEEAAQALKTAREAEARLSVAVQRLDECEQRRRAAAREREEASTASAVARTAAARFTADVERRRADLSEWRAGWGSLRARHGALAALVRALEPLAEASARAVAERRRLVEAQGALAQALERSPFADAATARRALLSDAEGAAVRHAVEAHRAEEQAIAGLLSSAAAVRAIAAEEAAARSHRGGAGLGEGPSLDPELSLAACAEAVAAAEARLAVLQNAAHSATASRTRCESLHADFRASLPDFARERARADLLGELQRTARGSGENRLRMSLHRYVLAARLEQVAVAASERLGVMSDGRFSLEHTDALAARGAASGLGLEVMDAWTGQRRDPATLSGGESFMASLALALGLADVVQHESGGVDIETLFVDEGFGTLDEQTLEQVMEAIEGLRDGGRTVGLVSHVPELKQRIPAQIRVTKGRSGSTLEIVAGTGAI